MSDEKKMEMYKALGRFLHIEEKTDDTDSGRDKADIERMRREFTASASHELKTPLTTISGYAEMMANGMVKPEDMKEFSLKIYKESSRMLRLIDDIINLSELDEGAVIENPEKIDLAHIASEAILVHEKAAKEKGIQIFFSHEPTYIMGDALLLSELVSNLLDNAIKYSGENGKIRVFVGDTTKGAELSIKDTGIGIPEKDRERIFERFYRVDKSRSKRVGGTGLGLSIVKHICALHSADIRVKSEVGKGSTFYVTFPK